MEFPSIVARRGKGDAFFAIKGENRDGHDFVDSALKGGAGLAVVARDQRDRFAGAPLLVVPDVLEALRNLARAARARTEARVIAVTGSVGKTGTKEALRLALSTDGETHASVASYNNHWGVPLSLARCPASTKYAVLEIGMNHAGEITPLQSWHVRMWPLLPELSQCTLNTLARSRRSPMPRQKFLPGSSQAAPLFLIGTTRSFEARCRRQGRTHRTRGLLRRTQRR